MSFLNPWKKCFIQFGQNYAKTIRILIRDPWSATLLEACFTVYVKPNLVWQTPFLQTLGDQRTSLPIASRYHWKTYKIFAYNNYSSLQKFEEVAMNIFPVITSGCRLPNDLHLFQAKSWDKEKV